MTSEVMDSEVDELRGTLLEFETTGPVEEGGTLLRGLPLLAGLVEDNGNLVELRES